MFGRRLRVFDPDFGPGLELEVFDGRPGFADEEADEGGVAEHAEGHVGGFGPLGGDVIGGGIGRREKVR